jgi:hypothetical protein
LLRRGGNPPAPAFPARGNGKGVFRFLAAAGSLSFLPIAESPGFHSHSLWEGFLPVPFGVLIQSGAAISVSN